MSIRSRIANEYWITSGFFTMLKNISGILLAFGGFYFLVRILDKNTFGVWSLFLGTTTLIEFCRNGLVSNAFLRFLASATPAEYPKIVRASFTVTGVLTLIGVVVNLGIARWLSILWHMPQVEYLFYLYTIVFILTGCINQFNCIQQANLKFNGIFQSSITGAVLSFCYILIAYYTRMPVTLMNLMYVQIAGAVIAFFIAYFHTRKFIRINRTLERDWVKKMLGYGKFSFGTILSAMIFNSIDQWMLGSLLAPAAAGAYNIAVRITNIVEVPTGTIATIVFPQSARRMAIDGPAAAGYLYEKSVGAILAFLIPGFIFLYLFSGPVVHFIAGSKYPESAQILNITILYSLFIPFSRQFGTILDSIGRPKINFYIVLLSALANVVANYCFIRSFGIIGAAYGTLTASIFNFMLCQIILGRTLGVNALNAFRYALRFYPDLFRKYIRPSQAKEVVVPVPQEEAIVHSS